MAQPSVAREPSMEEILASIRRIIESNEVDGAKPAVHMHDDDMGPDPYDSHATPLDVDAEEEIHLTIDDSLPSFATEMRPVAERPAPAPVFAPPAPQVSVAVAAPVSRASQPEYRASAPQPASPHVANQADNRAAAPEEPRSISLADVAARVRAASERAAPDQTRHVAANQGASRSVELRPSPARAVEQSQVRPAEVVAEVNRPEPVLADAPRAITPVEARQPARSAPAPQAERAVSPVLSAAERVEEVAVSMFQAEAAATRAASSEAVRHEPDFGAENYSRDTSIEEGRTAAEIEDGKSLVSTSTGDQVARSFKELADLVNSTPQRTLDEVAEQLLRPMLQEWLDDNLPTLVERLVREEIERVARGPRR